MAASERDYVYDASETKIRLHFCVVHLFVMGLLKNASDILLVSASIFFLCFIHMCFLGCFPTESLPDAREEENKLI